MPQQIITRFAPSPTGELHIGGIRTALYSYLFARQQKGKFLLRIEDTDTQRSTVQAEKNIISALAWLGLQHDDKIVHQSHRLEIYANLANQLLSQGKAYKCDCTPERLNALRDTQLKNKQKPRYDGFCKNRQAEISENYVVRLATSDAGEVTFNDLIHGIINIANSELDDFIILRSDGMPTYHLACVIDDAHMNVSHVIRGDDHLANTARHIHLIHALGFTPPDYAHLAMVLGEDGQKLSKRNGTASVLEYRQQGFVPEAILNALVRVGWSHGDQEIFSLAEMIELFDFKHVQKSAARLDINKMQWLNKKYLADSNTASLVTEMQWHLEQQNFPDTTPEICSKLLALQANKANSILDIINSSYYLLHAIPDKLIIEIKETIIERMPALHHLATELVNIQEQDWLAANIKQAIKNTIAKFNLKFADIGKPLRVIVSGDTNNADLAATLEFLGKEQTRVRIGNAINVAVVNCR